MQQLTQLERIPPHSIEAEQATLGSMMLDRERLVEAETILEESDFYRPSHGEIFTAMRAINDRNEPVDLIMLKDEMIRRDRLEAVGGVEYLMALIHQVPSASRVTHYANIVKAKSELRGQIRYAMELQAMAFADDANPEDISNYATSRLIELSISSGNQWIDIKDAVDRAMDNINQYMLDKGKITGPRTGLSKIDSMTMGLDRGLTIVAAGTGVGKTAFLLQIARQSRQLPGAFFQLEMGAEELSERLIISTAGLDGYRLRVGAVSGDEDTRIWNAAAEVSKLNLKIYDEPININKMLAMAQQAILRYGIKYILVDYLGLIEPPKGRKNESRNYELGAIARGLQKLSRKYAVPVIAACQLSREFQKRPDKRPILSDLRDSGELEQHAYTVIFLSLLQDQNLEAPEVNVLVDLAKRRNGRIGTQKAMFRRQLFTFHDIDDRHEEEPNARGDWTKAYD